MSKFSPRQVAVWLAFSLFLASCGKDKLQAPRNAADLTIHAASDEAVSGWNVMKFWDASGGEIWIEPTAALTLDDIQRAEQTRDDLARTAITIRFTAAGAEKMRKFSSEHIGKKAAIVFEGKVMNAPVIMSAISSHAIITTGSSGLSADHAERILAIVNQ
jgi:preprotein translocase subunit SecD